MSLPFFLGYQVCRTSFLSTAGLRHPLLPTHSAICTPEELFQRSSIHQLTLNSLKDHVLTSIWHALCTSLPRHESCDRNLYCVFFVFRLNFLSINRFERKKNIALAISAFAMLRSFEQGGPSGCDFSHVTLTIAGNCNWLISMDWHIICAF